MDDELSPEDLLRLNVLMAQDLKAVRLDEGGLTLHALTPQGEASMPLHPTCREDRYLRLVREFLSGHALGSPGGYPVHLTRWTRHGQLASPDLGKLLLTGEPEAVTAVVYAPGLTDEIAEYAWWAMPSIENARLMLRREAVARGRMGKVLADFLIEHLPFLQDEHLAIIDTVAVLLASGAVDEAGREAIWKRGRRANSHYVAFLEMAPDNLPSPRPARADLERWQAPLTQLKEAGNACAGLLLQVLSGQGQTFLATFGEIFERPETQEVVSRSLNAIGRRFAAGPEIEPAAQALAAALPELADDAAAVAALGRVSEALTAPVFARSTAIGSLMRRKIEPLLTPLLRQVQTLLTAKP
ncbi:hypothetical protein EDC61_11229 [Sulfuritortus calidifontis]|uniref:Sulfur reduction protein DsrS n=1 Tax=Sulfuritortus calidifontis TaxID=1914471 RepID=A0A4R3JVT4_9PROT|nr:hypothetical protein [Sulfuritortus calidifontis]TCS71013.1 hypothetical protein EDC61_11229 [Sulfuritortus calidifontis]